MEPPSISAVQMINTKEEFRELLETTILPQLQAPSPGSLPELGSKKDRISLIANRLVINNDSGIPLQIGSIYVAPRPSRIQVEADLVAREYDFSSELPLVPVDYEILAPSQRIVAYLDRAVCAAVGGSVSNNDLVVVTNVTLLASELKVNSIDPTIKY